MVIFVEFFVLAAIETGKVKRGSIIPMQGTKTPVPHGPISDTLVV